MIETSEVLIERIAAVVGHGEALGALAVRAAREVARGEIGAVIAATFSNRERFPALAVRVAGALGLPRETLAFDLQLACSAYPYAVYLAGKLSADTGKRVLVIDGDVQSPLVDTADHATGAIFNDACTATLVHSARCLVPSAEEREARSYFDFMSEENEALTCSAEGPIHMDGFKVFSFVATEVSAFLKHFLSALRTPHSALCTLFAPHQANPYMVRQLAKSLGLEKELVTLDESLKNPGSCSVAMALAAKGRPGARALIAGFGAGYSASVGLVRLADDFQGVVL